MKVLPFDSSPGLYTIPLGDYIIKFNLKYNYRDECWVMDITDTEDNPVLSGLKLVPYVDILSPYPSQADYLGGLVVAVPDDQVENYKSPDALGAGFLVVWFEPGEEVVLQ